MTTAAPLEGVVPQDGDSSSDFEKAQELDIERQPQGTDNASSLSKDAANASPSDANTPGEQRSIRGLRWAIVLVAIFAANVLYGLDTTIAADIQAAVAKDLGHLGDLGWLGYGFCLGSAAAILPLGKAYSLFDVKWTYLLCLVMFAAGSALCGAAPSMGALIVGRVWAGVGGAGMYLGTLNLMTTLTMEREQAMYIGLQVLMYGAGCLLGPVVGGLLADSSATWRWAFYLNLVIFGATSPFYLFALPSIPRHADKSLFRKLLELDWVGIVLYTALNVSLTLAFSFGGTAWAWSDGRFIALVVLFGIFAITFAATQRYAVFTTKEARIFPVQFLADLQMVLLYVCMAASGAALFVSIYYIPLYFQFVQGSSGTQAAVRLLPFVAFYIASVVGCGYGLPRTGYHWVWYLLSGLFQIAGGAAMYAAVDIDSAPSRTYGLSVLLGLGMATSQAGYNIGAARVAHSAAGPAMVPEAIQFLNAAQGTGLLLGLLIASAVFQNEAFDGLQVVLAGQGYSDAEIRAAVAGSQSSVLDGMSADLRRQCLEAIVQTIQRDWILVLTAGAVLVVCSCFMTKSRY